ncbi:MAG: DinB family protein [Bacteroidota bacterium]
MINHFTEIFHRDIQKWKEEILAFKNEEDLWKVKGGFINSAGNLTLHIIGNLNHFIGAQLGNTGYIREREKEFSDKNVLRDEMLKNLESASALVTKVLSGLNENDLEKIFPLNTFGENRSTHFVLLQLVAHLNYHLGQVNALRRLL